MAEAGIRIDGKLYVTPKSMRVGETRMIKRISGLNPPEFMQALNTLDKTQDPDVGAALVWWVLHREDPSFTVEAIDELEWSSIESEDGEEPVAPVDPKDDGATSVSSLSSANESSSSPAAPGETTPASGGAPDLVPSGLETWAS